MAPPSSTQVTLSLRIQPGARREGVVGRYGEAIKVAIAAPAVDGKANEALIRLLSSLLGVPRSQVEVVAGETSRSKLVRVTVPSSRSAAEIEARLLGSLRG